MDKGAKLNKSVWTLFEKVGFKTEPNSQSAAEHIVKTSSSKTRRVDLYAQDQELGVTIVGSNKSGSIDSWQGHVNDYTDIGQRAGASKVLFVITGKELAQEDLDYAHSKNACVWTETQLRYYMAVADAIGKYAKFEIIHALGLSTDEQKETYKVLALRLRQPAVAPNTELFLFTMNAELLLRMCVLFRRAQGNANAYQRMLRKTRLPKVRDFVCSAGAILPTNIIVHLSNKVTVTELKDREYKDQAGNIITLTKEKDCDLVVLDMPKEYASFELIDGQHRLYGFVDADDATKKTFNLVVLGVKGLTLVKRQETFVAINDNSRRMDPNLVSYLKYTDDDFLCQQDNALMAIRIVVELNKDTPFKNSIRLLDVGDEVITLKGFSGYDLKGLLGERGLLRKYYPNNKPAEHVQALRIYFSTIRSLFKKEWKDPHTYIVATNRGVSAFLKLLRSILRAEKDQLSHDVVLKYLEPLKSGWKTWETDKLSEKYVGSQGWKQLHRDMVEAIQKKFPAVK